MEKETVDAGTLVFVDVNTDKNPMTSIYKKLNIFEFDDDPEKSEEAFEKLN